MKIKTLLAAAAVAFAFTSCDNDGGNEYHSTYFYPMTSNGSEVYADQTVDSVRVISYDSWSLKNTCDWYQVFSNGKEAPLSINIPAGYMSSDRLDFKIQPNTTGKVRKNPVEVVSSFHKIGTVSQMLTQYPYLNIKHPGIVYETEGNQSSYNFTLTLPASGLDMSNNKYFITFTVYADGATLSSDASWVSPDQTEGFKKYADQKVTLSVEKNQTNADRTATLTLTSNGISTPIIVKQAK